MQMLSFILCLCVCIQVSTGNDCGNITILNSTRSSRYWTTPGYYSDGYNGNTHLQWLIQAPENEAVYLAFSYFNLETSTYCSFDSISIYDGNSIYDSLIGKFCGSGLPETIRSTTNMLYISFRTDGSVEKKGARCRYTSIVHGIWSSWNLYADCTVTCGGGTRERTRTCTNPEPNNGGLGCAGISRDSDTCNTQPCPINGGWSSWRFSGVCTVTCGGGLRIKTRTCTNPTPANCGSYCSGDAYEKEPCNSQNCPIHGSWSSWNAYTDCTVTCGGGTRERIRTCTNPVPNNGGLGCAGISRDSDPCNTQPCPINGAWSSWRHIGDCTITCGGGLQIKTRTCTNPRPAYFGSYCSGDGYVIVPCNIQDCSIDGSWSCWFDSSECSVPCGGGVKEKSRTCTNPEPALHGFSCDGHATLNFTCNTQPCLINGGWSTWSDSSDCSVSCGGGQKEQTRTCTNPQPSHGGLTCVGPTLANVTCNLQCCQVGHDSLSDIGGTPTVIAISLGTIVLVAIVILLAIFCLRIRRQKLQASTSKKESAVHYKNSEPGLKKITENVPYMDLDTDGVQRVRNRNAELTIYQSLK